MKIGVFDSGVGGLTVLKAMYRLIPQVDLIYFGDSIHLPYGNKSSANILDYSLENYRFLLQKKVEIIVIACNTSSAIARSTLERTHSIPLIDVIGPGVDAALEKSLNQIITVASTFRTKDSHVYRDEILKKNRLAKVVEVACPSLVSLIEEGFNDRGILKQVLRHYLVQAVEKADTLVLGCTHYPLIKNLFKETFPQLSIVDSAEATAKKVKNLVQNEFAPQSIGSGSRKVEIYTNDKNEVFVKTSKKLFPGVSVKLV